MIRMSLQREIDWQILEGAKIGRSKPRINRELRRAHVP